MVRFFVSLTCMLGLFSAATDSLGEVVVLRNGNLLEGRTEVLGDQVLIDTGTSQLRLARRDVEQIGNSRVEAYELRRQAMVHPSADGHAALAEWCLRNDMLPQAAREINDARTRHPDHRALPELQARMAAAIRRMNQPATPEPVSPAVTSVAENQELAELERLAASLDPEVIERFTRNIQPIVVHNCGTAGCHAGDAAGEFRLNRDLVHGMANRRSTLRNLQATLSQVDRQNSLASPLLVVPAAAHGDLPGPVFRGRKEPLFDKMVDWANLVAGVTPASPVVPAYLPQALPDDDLLPPSAYLDGPPSMGGATPPNPDESAHFWEVGEQPTVKMAPTQIGGPAPVRDEFDPEIFNRRFGRP